MKKIQKSKKGFTLVEMVLVIAIIVILAAVLIIGITKYLNGANAAKKSISEHQSAVEKVVDDVNGQVPGVFV
ncbi:MAG: type II secretion system protein [Ruminococcaceae bacterium]|jgi:type IV pilus assembly protein PilA|nr:type II secretion system protein [Oscillospiraceae bacterium]